MSSVDQQHSPRAPCSSKRLDFSDNDFRPPRVTALLQTLRKQVEELRVLALLQEEQTNELQVPAADLNLKETVSRFETFLITQALIDAGGHPTHAARALGVKASTLSSKIKKYRINVKRLNTSKRLDLRKA